MTAPPNHNRQEGQQTDGDLRLQVGELSGRMNAVERDQQRLAQQLDRIDQHLQTLSRRMAWFAGAIAVLVPLASFGGWYAAHTGLPSISAVEVPGAPLEPAAASGIGAQKETRGERVKEERE